MKGYQMDLAKAARDPWVWAQGALFVLIGVGVPIMVRTINLGWADPIIGRLDARTLRLFGLPVLATGVGVVGWGIRSLGKSLTPGVEPMDSAVLVQTGAYAHSRHPIYLGVVLVIAGYTLFFSNWRMALLMGWGVLLFFRAKARAEEKYLVEKYSAYRTYQRCVPMIVPWARPQA